MCTVLVKACLWVINFMLIFLSNCKVIFFLVSVISVFILYFIMQYSPRQVLFPILPTVTIESAWYNREVLSMSLDVSVEPLVTHRLNRSHILQGSQGVLHWSLLPFLPKGRRDNLYSQTKAETHHYLNFNSNAFVTQITRLVICQFVYTFCHLIFLSLCTLFKSR